MGKFVVIPKHPSNEFFYGFPNCLAYEDVQECVDKMRLALSGTPKPLSPQDAHRLSWEGATERLYRASRISVAQDKEYRERHAQEDEKAARLHIEGTTHSNNLRNFLNDKLLFDL
jgi:digalactosyldiacylglycerol synthase